MHLDFYFEVDHFAMEVGRQLARLILELDLLPVHCVDYVHAIAIPCLLDGALTGLLG